MPASGAGSAPAAITAQPASAPKSAPPRQKGGRRIELVIALVLLGVVAAGAAGWFLLSGRSARPTSEGEVASTSSSTTSSPTGEPRPTTAPGTVTELKGELEPLRYLPADSSVVMGIDAGTLMRTPPFQEPFAALLQSPEGMRFVANATLGTGIKVEDFFDQVVVATQGVLPLDRTVPNQGPECVTFIVKSRVPFDTKKMRNSPEIVGSQTVSGRTYHQIKITPPSYDASAHHLTFSPSAGFFTVGDRIAVFAIGKEERVKAVMTAPAQGRQSDVVDFASRVRASQVWVLVPVDGQIQDRLKSGVAQTPPELQPAIKALEQAKAVGLWLTASKDELQLSVGLLCADEKTAQDLAGGIEPFVTKFKAEMREQLKPALTQLPPELGQLLDEAVNTTSTRREQRLVALSTKLGMTPLQALVKRLSTEGPGPLLAGAALLNERPVAPPAALSLRPVSAPPLDPAKEEKELLALINQLRGRSILPPLDIDPRLMQAARNQAAAMARAREVKEEIQGKDATKWVAETGYAYDLLTANLAAGPDSRAADAYRSWLAEARSRSNLLRREFLDCGIGIVANQGEVYYVLVLAAPRD